MKKSAKYLVSFSLGSLLAAAGGLYATWLLTGPEPEQNPFEGKGRRPLVMAHRGGAALWPENTLYAFERAQSLGVDVIETDVQSTSDGVLVVMHDATVERTTDGSGPVNQMTLAQLKRLDAGYRWTPDGGRTFPLRGRGITVPTLEEVFKALPRMRFNIEPKQGAPSIIEPLCDLISKHGMTKTVVIGSFSEAILGEVRQKCPEVATSASPEEVRAFIVAQRNGFKGSENLRMQAFQVPEYAGGLRVLTEGFVAAAHNRGVEVHAWTVNETEQMRRLLEMGVDGIMTDYPDRLLRLLGRGSAFSGTEDLNKEGQEER